MKLNFIDYSRDQTNPTEFSVDGVDSSLTVEQFNRQHLLPAVLSITGASGAAYFIMNSRGNRLSYSKTLQDYDFQDGDTLYLVRPYS